MNAAGLVLRRPRSKNSSRLAGLPTNRILSLKATDDGALYIGTDGAGLWRLEPDGTTLTQVQQVSGQRVLQLVYEPTVTPSMLLVLTDRSLTGALAAGVPGSVAGLFEAHRKYGTKPWADLVQPAVELAERGFVVDTAFSEDSEEATTRLAKDSASAALFLRDGRFVAPGTRWRAPELAAVLRRIAEKGRDGFYSGETAASIVAAMQKSGGIISRADLAGYKPVWRSPVKFDYRGHHVVSMPPASSGGLTLALILGIVGLRRVRNRVSLLALVVGVAVLVVLVAQLIIAATP
jgi:hypothetical protein